MNHSFYQRIIPYMRPVTHVVLVHLKLDADRFETYFCEKKRGPLDNDDTARKAVQLNEIIFLDKSKFTVLNS